MYNGFFVVRPITYPLVFVIGIVVYITLTSLAVFLFRKDRKEHLYFALLSATVLIYDLCSFGLYNSEGVADALLWQRGQLTSAHLVSACCVPFIFNFLNLPRTRAASAFTVAFLLFAGFTALPMAGALDANEVVHRDWQFRGAAYDHYEASPGLVTQAAYVVMVAGMVYGAGVASRAWLRERLPHQLALVFGLLVFFLFACVDILNGLEVISFIYTLEYSFVSVIVLMNYSLISRFAHFAKAAGQKQAELEELVRARTADIQELASRLEEQNRRLEHLAATDGLTGLLSHAAFKQRLKGVCNAASRHGFSFALVMIDVDDFKRYNDQFGHPFGDEVIGAVTDVLRNSPGAGSKPRAGRPTAQSSLRDYDVSGRYGGDEFVVILMYCAAAEAELVTRRLEDRVRGISFEQHPEVQVTLSIGVACRSPDARATSHEQLLVEADRALYQAKQAGKNRHCVVSVA